MPRLSRLASQLQPEMAFTVLARARALKALGKDVVELEIGDSRSRRLPLRRPPAWLPLQPIRRVTGRVWACPRSGRRPPSRSTPNLVLMWVPSISWSPRGAKPFEQYFAEALLEPGDGVLIFSPHFPTYIPNLERRGARAVLAPLSSENQFRPSPFAVSEFLRTDPRPRAIFLNSPQNPTGGVATRTDLKQIAEIVQGTDLMVFSDEPYAHMVWEGRHESIMTEPGMIDHVVSAFTFSKSYSMSGWRIGFAVAHPEVVEAMGKLINTTASCSPPFVQQAALAALEQDSAARDQDMSQFRRKVERLVEGLKRVDGLKVAKPLATFYVFPDVRALCNRFGITSHGLALYLLEGADDDFGVACLGGESFGEAGRGFLRFSCAEPDERIDQAMAFLPEALKREDRVAKFLADHAEFALGEPFPI